MITPSTFVIGAGPVATALAGALRLGGVPVLGLWARRPEQARLAGATAGVAAYSAAPPDLLLESDAVLLAVRDEAIAPVAQTLLATGLITGRHTMLHCSGAVAAESVFADIRARVGGVATLHPLRAIADGRIAMRELRGTVFGVEGDSTGLPIARALVEALGGAPLELGQEQMSAYHAAAAIASNYTLAVIDLAAEVLGSAGIARADALGALVPLVRGTLDNLDRRGLPEALTGPLRRGDTDTVVRHLRALSPDQAQLYRQLGLRTLSLARELNPTSPSMRAAMQAIEALLVSDS